MNTLIHRMTLAATLAATLGVFAGAAQAADLKISCEKRSARSKVSVDGNNLRAGTYFAVVTSGGNTVQGGMASTVGDEVEFDFDSSPGDIAQGAAPIAANFIVDGRVAAQLRDAAGNVVASGTAICRVRR
ncbi:MAG: hypothetical protein JNL30_02825 [Rubrivivax sp.]|nr:hypothetical protein [Rubrivivax sp.]